MKSKFQEKTVEKTAPMMVDRKSHRLEIHPKPPK